MLATAVLAGMARVGHIDPLTDHAGHDLNTEIGCAVGLARTPIDPWGDFSAGRWLWFLDAMKPLPEALPAVGPPVLLVLGYLRRVVVVYHLLLV